MAPSGPDVSRAASMVTQSQADRCCAAAEGHDSGAPVSTFAPSTVLVTGSDFAASDPPAVALPPEGWRTLVPLPRALVAKHLLLSVFLL